MRLARLLLATQAAAFAPLPALLGGARPRATVSDGDVASDEPAAADGDARASAAASVEAVLVAAHEAAAARVVEALGLQQDGFPGELGAWQWRAPAPRLGAGAEVEGDARG